MLDNIDGFIESVFEIKVSNSVGSLIGNGGGVGTTYIGQMKKNYNGDIYCPKCSGVRRMSISLISTKYNNGTSILIPPIFEGDTESCFKGIKILLAPSLWIYKCTQCDTIFTVVFYRGANGAEIAILPSCNGGVVTSNTPTSVAYYLDQAYRAKSVGANSACIAMYRGALDQLMHEQGYTEGMLGIKLKNLQQDINNGTAKKWAKDLDINLLSYLNALGSGSIHPNDGDIEKQKELDNELITLVEVVFGMLLDKIYEQPKREENWKNSLEEKSKSFSWKKTKK